MDKLLTCTKKVHSRGQPSSTPGFGRHVAIQIELPKMANETSNSTPQSPPSITISPKLKPDVETANNRIDKLAPELKQDVPPKPQLLRPDTHGTRIQKLVSSHRGPQAAPQPPRQAQIRPRSLLLRLPRGRRLAHAPQSDHGPRYQSRAGPETELLSGLSRSGPELQLHGNGLRPFPGMLSRRVRVALLPGACVCPESQAWTTSR